MSSDFLLYGSTGFVGSVIARLAVQRGLRPILAGRDAAKVKAQAAELGMEHRVFGLDDSGAFDRVLSGVPAVLNCAGPFVHTFKPMVDACLRAHTHYLDLTGEIDVYETLALRDSEAKAQRIMILPGVGFDVVATDCLAQHLKRRLPTASHLTLAFHIQGPAAWPPGTANTMVEVIPQGTKVRKEGRLVLAPRRGKRRMVDFGDGPVKTTLLAWGDVSMAFYSTGIPNIEDYAVLSEDLVRQMMMASYLRPLFKLPAVRRFVRGRIPTGSTAEDRAATRTHVWGEVQDGDGRTAAARLHGPDGGVVWTSSAAVAAVQEVLAGHAPPGFQTPSLAYGPDFVLKCEGVIREDVRST
jgi:short subunit dehydrogenase-like uncharacterized protein